MKTRAWCCRTIFLSALLSSVAIHAADTVRLFRTSPPTLDRFQGQVTTVPVSHIVDVPWSGQEVASIYVDGAPKRFVRWWQMTDRGRSLKVALDWVPGGEPPAVLTVEAAPGTHQLPDGRWIFRVADASAHDSQGGGARVYEWSFPANRAGNYSVEITGNAWEERTEAVDVHVGEVNRSAQLDYTGSRRRMVSKTIGVMRIPAAGPQRLRVRVGEPGRAIRGTLTAVVLRPAAEGVRVRSGPDQGYDLRIADAALAGTNLSVSGSGENAVVRGWTEEAAGLEWLCEDLAPGRYSVELIHRAEENAAGELEIRVGTRTFRTPVVSTANAGPTERRTVGEIEILQTGDEPVSVGIRGARGTWSVSGLKLVRRGT